MVKCSNCENYKENVCKFNIHAFSTIKENVKCLYYKESKTKEKQIKDKVNIFNLNFPFIYIDTDTDYTILRGSNLPKNLLKKKYALNLKYSQFTEKGDYSILREINKPKNRLKDLKREKILINHMKKTDIWKFNNKEAKKYNHNDLLLFLSMERAYYNLEKENKFLLQTIDNISLIELKNSKENIRLSELLSNTNRAYQIISKEYNIFKKKNSKCEKIGQLNKIGFRKEYSCKEFSKIDKNFIKEIWCNFCKNEEYKMKRIIQEEKILNLIRKGISTYNMLSLESKIDKKVLDEILFNLMLSGEIFESSPANYLILK